MDIPLRPHEDFPTQVILRCLYGALASRPDIEVLHLPIRVTDPKTQLARHSNGVLYLRDETPENSVARDVLARFGATLLFTLLRRCDFKPNVEAEVYSRALVLENFTEDTYIELPPSPSPYFAVRGYNDDQVPLQHSVRGERPYFSFTRSCLDRLTNPCTCRHFLEPTRRRHNRLPQGRHKSRNLIFISNTSFAFTLSSGHAFNFNFNLSYAFALTHHFSRVLAFDLNHSKPVIWGLQRHAEPRS